MFLTYYRFIISLSTMLWHVEYNPHKTPSLSRNSGISKVQIAQRDTSPQQQPVLQTRLQQDADTIILEEIQINRLLFQPDSLQARDYFKKLSQKTTPSWQSIFIDRATLSKPMLPNRGSSTSSLLSIDLLSVIGKFRKSKSVGDDADVVWHSKNRYIEQHFDSLLVKKMTGLTGIKLQEFVRLQRPSVHDISDTVIYELMRYIKTKYENE